jgi:hypothetical protein
MLDRLGETLVDKHVRNPDENTAIGTWVSAPEDAKSIETREVYAYAGVALYLAQCLEHEIVNSLGLAEIVRIWRTNRPQSAGELAAYRTRVDEIWDENYDRTLGQLLNLLRKSGISIPTSLDSLLRESLRVRNRLVHEYFREQAKDWFDADGRRAMANELETMQALFRKTDHTLHEVTAKIRNAFGMTEDKVNLVGELMKANASEEDIDRAITESFGEAK